MLVHKRSSACAVCGSAVGRNQGAIRLGRGVVVHNRCAVYRRPRERARNSRARSRRAVE